MTQKKTTRGQMCGILRKWKERKLLREAQTLQKAADNNNMHPIWNYVARAKNAQKPKGAHQALKRKTDNTLTQNKTELITRWAEWIKQKSQKNTSEQEKPQPMHIPETKWGQN